MSVVDKTLKDCDNTSTMITFSAVLSTLKRLYGNYGNKKLLAVGTGVALVTFGVLALSIDGNAERNVSSITKTTTNGHGNISDASSTSPTAAPAGPATPTARNSADASVSSPESKKAATVTAAAVAAAPASVGVGATQTTVIKTTAHDDGTTTKEVVNYVAIPFATQTQNETNLKRGTTQVVPGQNGVKAITYTVTYDKNGKEIARDTTGEVVAKKPVTQITKVGVSDFNLNTDMWGGTEFGEICLLADYNALGDGCIGVPSDRYFSAVGLGDAFYVYCISSDITTCNGYDVVNIQPIIAVRGDNTFTYQGATYRADPRKGGGGGELITPAMCAQYGLACGSW